VAKQDRRVARLVAAASVLAAAASVAAVALGSRAGPEQRTVHAAPLSLYRPFIRGRVVRGGAIERSAAARALRAFGPGNRVLRIEFTTPPAAFGLPASALWVRVDVAAPDRAGSAFSIWQAFLVVSAIADARRSVGAAPVAGKTVQIVFPSGTTIDAGSTVDGPLPTTGDTAPASGDALMTTVGEAARHDGLEVAEQGSFDVGGRPAVFALLVTGDPARFAHASGAEFFSLQRAVYDAPAAAAGSFVEVRDRAGGVVAVGGIATRLQQGVGWTNSAFGS
jgi:hypothetical protein